MQGDDDIILIVDDVPENLRFLSDLLAQRGYDVRAAISGQMALTIVKTALPSLILLDILMPDMDGYEVCHRLKADPKTAEIPVIFLSALDELSDKITAFDAGGVDYITKPFHAAEVMARVRTHLALRHLQQKLQAANSELQRLVNIDGLTRVANRRRFDEYLEQEWHRLAREQSFLSLVLCDVDFFKTYNDIYGHQAGDECLCCLAQILQESACHPKDLVARYGGEEFAMILPNTPTAGALQVVQKVQSQVKQLQRLHAGSKVSSYVTFSYGIATVIPELGQMSSQLVKAADRALYQSKVKGRDRTSIYSSDLLTSDR